MKIRFMKAKYTANLMAFYSFTRKKEGGENIISGVDPIKSSNAL